MHKRSLGILGTYILIYSLIYVRIITLLCYYWDLLTDKWKAGNKE